MLGALLGGLAGLLFPAAGAAAGGAAATGIGALLSRAALPALGAGLGTLVTGGSGKDAIRNALLMGAGTAIFPGAADGLRGGLERLFGMGGEEPAAATPTMSTSGVRPRRRPAGLGELLSGQGMTGMESEARRALLDSGMGQGMTGMESEARRSTIPSISEINMVRPEGFKTPYNMVRPEGEVSSPYNMARPEAEIEFVPGMTRASDALGDARRRWLASNVDDPEAAGLATDFLLASRDISRLPSPLLLPQQYRYAQGGAVDGPGTGTSDSIPAEIYQDGKPVQKAKLSDGEFVMTAAAVKGAGNGNRERGISRMYELMRRFESGEMA